MSPTGETPAAEPITAIQLPDAVSLKMLENENEILRRRLDECSPYLKDGETPAQCIKRNRADVDLVLGLLAKEKQKAESAAPSAGPDLREQIEQLEKWAAMEYAPCHYNADAADGWADGYRSAIGAVLALLDAAKER